MGHGLDPGGHDDVVGPGHDALGGEVQRLLRGAALAVDGGGRHRLGPAGGQHGVAADVERLLRDLHDAAHDHVVHQGGVEVVALRHGPEGLGGEVDGVPVAQLPVALAAGRPDGIDDDCGGHDGSPPDSGGPLPGRVDREHPTRATPRAVGPGPPGPGR